MTRDIVFEAWGDWSTCWMIQEATGRLPHKVGCGIRFRVTVEGDSLMTFDEHLAQEKPETLYTMKGPDGKQLPDLYKVTSATWEPELWVVEMEKVTDIGEEENE